jgi:serine/threonine protein kinase/Flp pilus assembly protein TadD
MATKPLDEEAIFKVACQIDSPQARANYLKQVCGDDQALFDRVATLLRAQEEAPSFLEAPPPGIGATVDVPTLNEAPGTVIGPYKLLQQIGEGGMGTVFMAEQTQPVQRKVALKVIKPGMDSRQVIARFEAERQALAMMDHVNIARVFDGGTTSGEPGGVSPGRPYFVMELVHGVPITKYCDDNCLTPRERLELFVPVCQAIQHAHQKGIIHRDVKPSNVMITLYDGKPVPKVIDFGVAKATEQKLTERTLFTQYGTMVGTFEYMSPEQAEMSALGVDTRSDIYSLGVLLYELLTGSTPLSHKRIKEAAYAEILRLIKEEEPPRPSTRLSDSGEALASISAQRKTEPAKLTKLVRGELDWIVMKTLEKDRNRRYETAKDFAMDVQRYLADEPVLACPPSAWYRFRKFARRNKAALGIAGLILFCVVLLGGDVGWILRERAGRLAEAVIAAEKTLDDVARLRREGKWPTALTLVQRAESLLHSSGADPALRRQLNELGADLGLVVQLEDIRLRKSEINEDGKFDYEGANRAYAAAFRDYGIDVTGLGPEEAAERLGTRPLAVEFAAALDDWAGCRQPEDAQGRNRLLAVARGIDADSWRNRVRDALAGGERTVLEGLAASAEIDRLPAPTLDLLAFALERVDAKVSAGTVLAKAVIQQPNDFWINVHLAYNYNMSRPLQPGAAVPFATAAAALRPESAHARLLLGNTLSDQGKLAEAEATYRKAIQLKRNYPMAYYGLGRNLRKQGKLTEAVEACRKAIQLKPDFVAPHMELAGALWDQGKQAESRAVERKLILIKADQYNHLGVARYRAGNFTEALAALETAMTRRSGGNSFDWFFVAMAHWRLDNKDEARKWYAKAVEWMDKNSPKNEELRRFRAEAAELLKIDKK